MVSSIVAAVKTAIQSTNAVQNSSSPTNLVADAMQHVSSITNTPVEAVESSGSEILPSAPLFSSIGVPLGTG